jgi:uncharacterized protein YacL (UPF0231 family)
LKLKEKILNPWDQYITQKKNWKNYNFENNLILNDKTEKKIRKNKIELMNDKIIKKNTKQYSNYSNEQCYVGVGKIYIQTF